MALSQALSTGITGLQTHQKAMDNIGNNLANVNTVGFKKGVFQFSTLLEQTMRGGMMADDSTGRGSINPIQLGLGAQTGSINKVFTQGPIENTGNPNDMAIDGNGFFVLRQGNGFAYTRNGSFYRGEDGTLMAGNGLFVQGTMAVKNADGSYSIPQDAKMQNIVIPIGTTGGHAQTSAVGFGGNLDSRQKVSTGTRLFGGTSYPTVSNLQQWMWKDFDGGETTNKKKVDTTWNALENKSFAMSMDTLRNYTGYLSGVSLPSNVTVYSCGVVADIPQFNGAATPGSPEALANLGCFTHVMRIDSNTGKAEVISAAEFTGNPDAKFVTLQDIHNAQGAGGMNYVPMVEEVKVVNGGNVQTSAAYGIKVPACLAMATPPNNKIMGDDGREYALNNSHTFPQWFYESTDAALSYKEITALPESCFATAAGIKAVMDKIWPDGFYGPDGIKMDRLPVTGETFPASLNTPLEHLQYMKGNVWTQPFNNIKNGDDIDIEFKKGESKIKATFTYNRPQGPDPYNGQVAVDRERSYTLEHFLKFLAGDVDEPTVACQRITPAMFGAPVDENYPEGNFVTAQTWNKNGYEEALRNTQLATDDKNWDTSGGAMGLLSIPPHVSDKNYGNSAYDAPPESAGAYTREGVQKVKYTVWDPTARNGEGQFKQVDGLSWNTSFVSNLGSQNALSDIKITYNNVPHDAMYTAETEYAAPQGGSSLVSVDFYDSLGNPKTAMVRMAMVSQDDDFTTWRWYADCTDDTDFPWQADPNTHELNSNLNVGTGLIRFDKNGNYVKGSEYTESNGITINQSKSGVNEPIWIKMLNGLSASGKQDLDFSEMTCTASANSFKLESQNGRPPGTLNSFTVSLDGTISGVYSNGNVVPIARIGLAIIPNENGLISAGNNLFYTGPASGDARYGHANTGGNGTIRHQQLESSNVDLSEEFTKLISTERGFQANSRTITTADEMITELLNLKR